LSEIQTILDLKKMTRKQLADLIGTSASYLTQLYTGNKIMNLVTMAKIKKVLDLNIEIKVVNNYFDYEVVDCQFKNTLKSLKINDRNVDWAIIKNLGATDKSPTTEVRESNKRITA